MTSARDAVFRVSLVLRLRPRSAVTGKEDAIVMLMPCSKRTSPGVPEVQQLQIQLR